MAVKNFSIQNECTVKIKFLIPNATYIYRRKKIERVAKTDKFIWNGKYGDMHYLLGGWQQERSPL